MPSGSDVTQRTDMKPAFSVYLLELILQSSNILQAWKRVRATTNRTATITLVTNVPFNLHSNDFPVICPKNKPFYAETLKAEEQ